MPRREKAKRWPVRPKPDWISSMTSTMPRSSQKRRRYWAKPASSAWKPPSPCTASRMMQPTSSTSISTLNRRSIAAQATSALTPLSALGYGRW
ncbi:hypothetical protein D3C78_1069120 [compost metagenome]